MTRGELLPYYDSVRGRAERALRVDSPQVKDWKHITEAELQELETYLHETRKTTSTIGDSEDALAKLNVDSGFSTHLQVMTAYVEVLSRSPGFAKFLQDQNISPTFMKALVLVHDFGRSIFNGPLPLTYVDGVSDGLLRKKIPHFPTKYLHSIKWITRETQLPENDDELKPHQVIGLILKAIDTLGKLDPEGGLMDPTFFFSENGPYAKWVEKQVANHRFPFQVIDTRRTFTGGRKITAEEYAQQDQALTLRGMELTEAVTGMLFSNLRLLAAKQFKAKTAIAG
jgi:hypothetical protein